MSYFKAVSIALFSIFITACDHPIEIIGEGRALSGFCSKDHACDLEARGMADQFWEHMGISSRRLSLQVVLLLIIGLGG